MVVFRLWTMLQHGVNRPKEAGQPANQEASKPTSKKGSSERVANQKSGKKLHQTVISSRLQASGL